MPKKIVLRVDDIQVTAELRDTPTAEAICAALRNQLGNNLFDALREEGRSMSLGQVISYALGKIPIS